MNEFEWQRRLRELAVPREPERDLWSGIAAQICAEKTSRSSRSVRLPSWAIAASLFLGLTGLLAAHWQNLSLEKGKEINAELAISSLSSPSQKVSTTVQSHKTDLMPMAIELANVSTQLQQAIEQRPDAVFLVSLLNRTTAQRIRLAQQGAFAG